MHIHVWGGLVLGLCGTPGLAACGSSSSQSPAAGGAEAGGGAASSGAGSDAAGGGSLEMGGRAGGGSSHAGAGAGGGSSHAGGGGGSSHAGAGGNPAGMAGSGNLGGAGASAAGSGGAPGGSCEDIPCADLGTCSVQHQGNTCTRTCSFTAKYTILTNDDVARLAALKCDALEASLDIGGAQVTSLAGLESIHQITGTVRVINADKLTDVNGVGDLETVIGDFSIEQSPQLTTLALPALKQVSGLISFVNLNAVTSIQTPALASVGQLLIAACPSVLSIRMDQLKTVSSELNINLNDNLSTLYGLPALTSAAKLIISSNPKLPQCQVDAIHARVGSAVQCSCNNNYPNGTCN